MQGTVDTLEGDVERLSDLKQRVYAVCVQCTFILSVNLKSVSFART